MERKRNPARPHQCVICLKSFLNKNDLVRHDVTHTKEKPHKCALCDKRYGLKTNLDKHMKHAHAGVREHKCLDCGKLFARKQHLQDHAETHILESEKNLACEKCGKKFGLKVSLDRHTNTRKKSKKKEHKCSQCGQTFSDKCLLEKHMSVAHAGTKIQCQECGKVFTLKSSLKRHQTTHLPELEPALSYTPQENSVQEFTGDLQSNFPSQKSNKSGDLKTRKNKTVTHNGLEPSSSFFGTTSQSNVGVQASNDDSYQKMMTGTLESNFLFQLTGQAASRIANQNHRSSVKKQLGIVPTMKCLVCGDEPGFKSSLVDAIKPLNMGLRYMCPKCDIRLESAIHLDEYFRKSSIVMHNW